MGEEVSIGIKDILGGQLRGYKERCGHPEDVAHHPITHQKIAGETPRDYLFGVQKQYEPGYKLGPIGGAVGGDIKIEGGAALFYGVEGAVNLSEIWDFFKSFK